MAGKTPVKPEKSVLHTCTFFIKIFFAACLAAVLLFAAACDTGDAGSNDGDKTPDTDISPPANGTEVTPSPDTRQPPTPDPDLYPGPDVTLVEYNGVIEHLFFHELIAWPEQAFGSNGKKHYDDYFVTVLEYERILQSLYDNNYILVDLNDTYSEKPDSNGRLRMSKNTLMLPEGKRPLVLSFDDINFYEYQIGDGFMDKLIIGDDGDIWAAGTDPDGNYIISQELTAVTALDLFVKENPDFSMHGVKGCIALTGNEGILGYRTQKTAGGSAESELNRMQEIARVRPVVDRLKETGWYFASHSYAHISLDSSSLDIVKADAERWMEQVGSLIGDTKIFIYPYGSRLDGQDVWTSAVGPALQFYHDLGFRFFASVGPQPYTVSREDISAVMLDRMNVDGITLKNAPPERFARFYDSAGILDDRRP